MRLNVTADNPGHFLKEDTILILEGGAIMAVNVDFSNYTSVCVDRHDDLRLRFDGEGQVAGIGGDTVNNDGLTSRDSRSADALIDRDAHVGRGSADKRAEH